MNQLSRFVTKRVLSYLPPLDHFRWPIFCNVRSRFLYYCFKWCIYTAKMKFNGKSLKHGILICPIWGQSVILQILKLCKHSSLVGLHFWSILQVRYVDSWLNFFLFQMVIWFIIPATRSPQTDHKNNALALIVLLQYVPRLYLIFPLSSQIIKATGVVTKTAWAGAAYNLLLYMLASHVWRFDWFYDSIFKFSLSLSLKHTYPPTYTYELFEVWIFLTQV